MSPVAKPDLKTRGTTDVEALGIGTRLREIRKRNGLTLNDLSGRAGVSRAAISKIERGDMSPTFDTMKKLSTGLQVDLVELFAPKAATTASGRRSIDRAGKGIFSDSPNYKLRALATDLSGKAMHPFVTVVRARSVDEFTDDKLWADREVPELSDFTLRINDAPDGYKFEVLGVHQT